MHISQKILGLMAIFMATAYIPASYAIDQTKNALNITTRGFGRSMDFTSDTTTSTRDKFKIVQAAKSDAAAYVASNGVIQGPYLNRALLVIRAEYSQAQTMNDLELATVILSIQ